MKKSYKNRRRGTLATLRQLLAGPKPSHTRALRRSLFGVETLEARELLAGDLDFDVLDPATCAATSSMTAAATGAEGESGPEGEDAPDLVAFARALGNAGVTFYGAAWCPACTEQKQLFEDGGEFLPFVEVTNPDRSPNQIATAQNITQFPTWVFQDGTRVIGVQSLQTLSQLSGVAIPASSQPFLAPLADTTLLGGSPLHVPLNGYDPNGGVLTYTVTSSNPLVTASILSGNRSARVSFSGFGDVTFQLFEQEAPRAAGQFIVLAQSGFYDAANNNPPITVHRAIDDFVFQFGDPTGTGAGGSSLPDFDDQFSFLLQHNTPGLFSWAKSTDDTNNSQVFVIDRAVRFLDFNHSVFGIRTEGESNRNAINGTATNASDRPINAININSVTIFNDIENGVLRLSAPEGANGEADITVTVTDEDGNQFQEVFHVAVRPDTFNGGPFLSDIPAIQTTVNTPAQFQLIANDVEGDPVTFSAVKVGNVNYTFNVNSQTGQVTVTPPTGFIGTMEILVRVGPVSPSNTTDPLDAQRVSIVVAPGAPTGVDLVAGKDSGFSNSDDLTNATGLTFDVSGVADGATVRLHRNGTIIGQAAADASGVATITTSVFDGLADGPYSVFATQILDSVESPASPSLAITLDRTVPGALTNQAPTTATVGLPYVFDAAHAEEGQAGFAYALEGAPTGASINAATGAVTWTPSGAQRGQRNFSIRLTDAAGNATSVPVSVNVLNQAQVVVRLEVTDVAGLPVTVVDVGGSFLLRGFVEDVRTVPQGVFAAFLDVVYDETRAIVTGPISYGSNYPNVTSGRVNTPGLIDEVGAAAGFTPLGAGEFLLFSVPMQATRSGVINFVADRPDNLPANEVLVYGVSEAVPLDEVQFGATSLNVNVSFFAVDDSFNFDEDTQNNELDVLANDQVTAGSIDDLTITAVGATSNGGTVTIAAGGKSLIYTPAPDFFGSDVFTYTISDETGSDTATVTVQVHPISDPPTAVDDAFTVEEDSINNFFNLLGNDSILPDVGETLTITSVSATARGGTLTIGAGGANVRYSPPANFVGTDTFTYTIGDGSGLTSQATVTVTVLEHNDPPTAGNDAYVFDEDSGPHTLDVLENDTTGGEEGQTLTIVSTSTPDNGGTVTIAADKRSLVYTPGPNRNGVDRFTYTIDDGLGATAIGNVNVNLLPKPDPPTANDDSFTVTRNSTANVFDVLANDSILPDVGETLTITSVSTPSAGGTVTITSNGTRLSYTPKANFTGTETFTYTINDGTGLTDTATTTVTIQEFVPGSLRGTVYIDTNNNGILENVEMRIGDVEIRLSGTDILGNAVSRTQRTKADGTYAFTNLAPGNYTISQQQPVFLIDGIDTVGSQGGTKTNDAISVVLNDGVNGTGNNFGERGRRPEYILMGDFLSSTPQTSILNAGDQWYAIDNGWREVVAASFQFENTASLPILDLSIQRTTQSLKASIDSNNPRRVQALGNIDGMRLIRLAGDVSDFNFVAVPPPSQGNGEGEAFAPQATAALAPPIRISPLATPVEFPAGVRDATSAFGTPAEGERVAPASTAAPLDPLRVDAVFDGLATREDADPAAIELRVEADASLEDYLDAVDEVLATW